MLDTTAVLNPPAPTPRLKPLGPLALLRVLASNPLEAWTKAHFEDPIVMGGLSVGRVAVLSEPVAIRRVLLENCNNYQKDWLQRRVLSAGLTNGLLTAEGNPIAGSADHREARIDFASAWQLGGRRYCQSDDNT